MDSAKIATQPALVEEERDVSQQVESSGNLRLPEAWWRYRIEYRHRRTNELVHFETRHADHCIEFATEKSKSNDPVFEVVVEYQTRSTEKPSRARAISADQSEDGSEVKSEDDSEDESEAVDALPNLNSTPKFSLKIYSMAIINALQSVVQYYPGQELGGSDEPVIICWPYAILVHHYDELFRFGENCASKDITALCVREKDAHEHLGLLLQYLDKNIMPDVIAEHQRYKNGMYSWENAWCLWKPGVTLLCKTIEVENWQVGVVHSVTGGIYNDTPSDWKIKFWSMTYDGKYLGRGFSLKYAVRKFDGEKPLEWQILEEALLKKVTEQDKNVPSMIEAGKMYFELLRKKCCYHKGQTREFPYNTVDGLVMADLNTFYGVKGSMRPTLLNSDDTRNWATDCICPICKKNRMSGIKKVKVRFSNYRFTLLENRTPTTHQYLLCPQEMYMFVFRTRSWEKLSLRNCTEPRFDSQMIDTLVMAPARLQTLKALAKSYVRLDKNEAPMAKEAWAADFVKGKGTGLTFLLHGPPGTGKTCTAECIAEFTKRPLMILTSSDIGTAPQEVELNLTKHFKTARSWGALLLIDEADIFMEHRSTHDLARNALVAGFLRALEFYDGILFLTTNRVGSFDDAFLSRIHVQLLYKNFTDEQRKKIWLTFVDKLARDRGNYIRPNIDAKEYLGGSDIRAVKWNGREIRNAFQTAVSLAEYDSEKDEEGKILITDKHIRAVVELSKDFKTYLSKLHQADESKRAMRRLERFDAFVDEDGMT